jgi:16S rRNA (cytosine967-C5)-methyltransferase
MLGELMGNRGTLVATDNAAKRLERLKDNMTRMGVTVETMVHDWEHRDAPATMRARFPEGFDRILLDVPCSNTGVLRRRVDVRWRLTPDYTAIVNRTQTAMLARLLGLLKPGGRLVYSTCSIEPDENALLVKGVLRGMPGYQKLEERLLLPHRDGTDGAYAALIERSA